jgi:hypothetical protein
LEINAFSREILGRNILFEKTSISTTTTSTTTTIIIIINGLSSSYGGFNIYTRKMKYGSKNFTSGGLYEKHAVATWCPENQISIRFFTQGNQENTAPR